MPADRRFRRFAQLATGQILYGVSDAMLVLAGLGLDPWDVLHQGLARHTPIPIGTWSILVGALVLLAWIPLRQRPGVGTVGNVVVIGSVIDIVLAVVPVPHAMVLRWMTLMAGVALNGFATACYIGAGLGPGPRDGLMTGVAARGHSIRVVRTAIEVTVLTAGWLLGGTVGIGTLLYAVSIGPMVHLLLPRLRLAARPGTRTGERAGPWAPAQPGKRGLPNGSARLGEPAGPGGAARRRPA